MNFYQNNIFVRLKIPISIIIDIFLCNLSLVISYSLRLEKFYKIYEIDKEILLYFNFIFLLIFFYYRFYNIVLRFFSIFNIKKITQYFFIYLILIIIFAVFTYNQFYLPRSVIILHSFIFFIFILSVRIFYSYFVNLKKNTSYNNVIIILGVNEVSINLTKNIAQFTNNKIIGFIEEKKDFLSREINGLKVYNINSLENLIYKFKATDLFVTKEKLNLKEKNIINNLRKNNTIRIFNIHKYDFYLPNLLRKSINNIDFNFSDIIQREEILPAKELLDKVIQGKTILITGSGGSIGSELCIQIINLKPRYLILMDNSELNLYNLQENLNIKKNISIEFVLGDCSDPIILEKIFKKVKIDIVYHAAAYKHVSILESNIIVSFKNNVLSTYYLCEKSIKYGVKNFTLISTDKAVNPKSVLGYSKRVSEKILLAFSKYKSQTNFSSVRFGNVIGSSGSVIPLFKRQIISGGPVTVTSKKVSRYFMSISEAVALILQSTGIAKTGDIFVLDMGSQINIYDIAVRMINLMGYSLKNQKNPNGDVEIKIIGLKRGEKLAEQLYLGSKKTILLESKKFKKTKIKELFRCIEEKEVGQRYVFKIKQYLNKYNLIKTKRDLKKLL
jgi:FlaA1/EpsC-like NDP-sugar epimerase